MNLALVMGTAQADVQTQICIVMIITSAQITLEDQLQKMEYVMQQLTVIRICIVKPLVVPLVYALLTLITGSGRSEIHAQPMGTVSEDSSVLMVIAQHQYSSLAKTANWIMNALNLQSAETTFALMVMMLEKVKVALMTMSVQRVFAVQKVLASPNQEHLFRLVENVQHRKSVMPISLAST